MTKEDTKKKLEKFLALRLNDQEDSINSKMQMHLKNWTENSVALVFPVNQWQLNPMGQMHGGMIATAFDITMGCASYVFSESSNTPTITMNLQYIRGIVPQKELIVKAIVDHAGSRITQIRAFGYQENEDSPCVSANGSYIINQ